MVVDVINLRHKKLTCKNINTLLSEKNIIIDDKPVKHYLDKSTNTVLQLNCSKNTCIPSKSITTNVVDHELFSTTEDVASIFFNVFLNFNSLLIEVFLLFRIL